MAFPSDIRQLGGEAEEVEADRVEGDAGDECGEKVSSNR